MPKDPQPYLKDILEYSDRIIKSLKNVGIEQFRADNNLQDAIIRRFEVIGEAVKRVPENIKDKYPYIPWANAAGFRDVLIHDYPDIVIDDVFITGTEHLPEFRNMIEEVLTDLKNI